LRVTIKDIARECKVSVATVSLALSNKPSRISETTRRQVLEMAEKLHYKPNQAAVSLVTKQSKFIGVIINDLRNSHIASLFMAIDQKIQDKGYIPICHILNDENKEENGQVIRDLVASGLAGMIWGKPYLDFDNNDRFDIKEYIEMAGIPVVSMDEYGFNCQGTDICFDYYQAGYLAAQHLIELGHNRIGCVTGPMNYKVTLERLNGYKKALKEAGIDFDKDLVYHGDYTMVSGSESLSYLLGQKATAIFSFNDEMAFGIYQSARQYGVHIPKDLSVIGCDNVPFSNVLEVPLSTIHVPVRNIGNVMGAELVKAIENKRDEPRRKIEYKPKLLLRGSTMKYQS